MYFSSSTLPADVLFSGIKFAISSSNPSQIDLHLVVPEANKGVIAKVSFVRIIEVLVIENSVDGSFLIDPTYNFKESNVFL